jgi:hypothetical protein
MDELVGSIRNPILLKCSCDKCDAKMVIVCGVKLFDPDGPFLEVAPPCKTDAV